MAVVLVAWVPAISVPVPVPYSPVGHLRVHHVPALAIEKVVSEYYQRKALSSISFLDGRPDGDLGNTTVGCCARACRKEMLAT